MKDRTTRHIALWLYIGAFCIFIQILLGGITRLTGSGLSITEWQPLLGFLPPMDRAAWLHSFAQYQQIAQFRLVNSQFTLADYQSIFFWEWLHRNWARMIGLVFIIPFIVFIYRGQISAKLGKQLVIVFMLGLLQAAIGWIMVKSGLNAIAVRVSDVKLAIHFMAAIILLSYLLWLAFSLSIVPIPTHYRRGIKNSASLTLGILLLQLCFGALMAGSKAALAAPTWPLINGYFIPPDLYHINLQHDLSYLLAIQLVHRTLAGLLIIMVIVLYKKTSFLQTHSQLALLRILPLTLLSAQVLLGIVTLIKSPEASYTAYAWLHQVTGILLLVSVLIIFFLSRVKFNALQMVAKKQILTNY